MNNILYQDIASLQMMLADFLPYFTGLSHDYSMMLS